MSLQNNSPHGLLKGRLLKFPSPLTEATLIKRYKRFLADVTLWDGKHLTIYCPNTGGMTHCDILGSRIWFSTSLNTQRKYPNTWELVEVDGGELVNINTLTANALVAEAISEGTIIELAGYEHLTREVKYGQENSRIDFRLTRGDEHCYVEVKSVTLCESNGHGFFPDAVTSRGTKHLRELMHLRQQGHRSVLLFCVQHTGIRDVAPANHIDPCYSQTLARALACGVEILIYQADISLDEIRLARRLPFATHS